MQRTTGPGGRPVVQRPNGREGRSTLGEGAGLVERDLVDFAKPFHHHRRFDEDSMQAVVGGAPLR